ncbi:hypothetical protein BH10ACT11_BH10ACT11_12660 [soil metagenome]
MNDRFDRVSRIAGVASVAMGAVLCLDQSGDVHLSPGLFGALIAAVLGLILLSSGLDEDGN